MILIFFILSNCMTNPIMNNDKFFQNIAEKYKPLDLPMANNGLRAPQTNEFQTTFTSDRTLPDYYMYDFF